MASDNSICKLLAAHDPSFSTDHNLIPLSLIEQYLVYVTSFYKNKFLYY